MPGALTGFLLIGPVLCTGLYELSRRIAAGERPRLGHAFVPGDAARGRWWRSRAAVRRLDRLGAGLGAAVQMFVTVPLDSPLRFLRYAVAGQAAGCSSSGCLAGGLGAALVFSLTVVSAPLLLDRRVSLRTALLASVRAVGDNPAPMALWPC